MIARGLTAHAALIAATATSAYALGLDEHVGTVTPGKLADLIVIDGDPLLCPELLSDRERIWLVIQRGEPVAGPPWRPRSRSPGSLVWLPAGRQRSLRSSPSRARPPRESGRRRRGCMGDACSRPWTFVG